MIFDLGIGGIVTAILAYLFKTESLAKGIILLFIGLTAALLFEFVVKPVFFFLSDAPGRAHVELISRVDEELASERLASEELRRRVATLGRQLADAEAAQPHFVAVGQKWVGLHTISVNAEYAYRFHVLSLWLVNSPRRRTPEALARNVSVRLIFRREQASTPIVELTTKWHISRDPESVGFNKTQDAIDVPANDVPVKCLLVLQHARTDDDCYVHSFGKLEGNPDGKYAPYRLAPGNYNLRLSLRGDNVDQDIEFVFANHGRAAQPEVLGVRKIEPPAEPSPAYESDDE